MLTPKAAEARLLLYRASIDNKLIPGVCSEIAREVGLSRERIRQIAVLLGYVMPREVSKALRQKKCEVCNGPFESTNPSKLCCSPPCYKIYAKKKYWTFIICKNKDCRKKKSCLKSLIELGRAPVFCSKKCQGKWLAREFGWGSQRRKNYPRGLEQLRKDFPGEFTTREFAIKYEYSSHAGAWTAINNLKLKGTVIDGSSRGRYKLRKKTGS